MGGRYEARYYRRHVLSLSPVGLMDPKWENISPATGDSASITIADWFVANTNLNFLA